MISYCMSEWPSKWKIEENTIDRKFIFAHLSKSPTTKLIETQLFYNCTLPYFGLMCQYMYVG